VTCKSKPPWDITLQPLRWPLFKTHTHTITNVGTDVEKLEPFIVGGSIKCFSCCGKAWWLLKKIKHRILMIHLINELKAGLKHKFYSHIHSSIIHNGWKVEENQVSINAWMGKEHMVPNLWWFDWWLCFLFYKGMKVIWIR
jgi:hypothetical protein